MRRLPPLLSLTVVLAVVSALVAAGPLPAAPSAAASGCAPAGGTAIPDPSPLPSGDFVFVGGGWGHGVGMSQYGAQGAAKLGCTVEQILTTYYPGVAIGQAPTLPEKIRVSLFPERPTTGLAQRIRVRAQTGPVVWHAGAERLEQPTGVFWRIDAQPDGTYRIHDEADGDALVHAGAFEGAPVRVPLDGPQLVQLSSKSTSGQWPEGRPYNAGTLEFYGNGGPAMFVTVEIPTRDGVNALERYLRGLSEMPSSWEPAALQAQAITGRSYAQDRWESFKGNRSGCRCDLYDSTSDQVYTGHLKESERFGGTDYGARWVAAVNATAGKTMRYEGKTAVGYYSSSHGGHSESNTFVWGSAQVPYLKPVDDSRWDTASPNPLRRWSASFTAKQVGEAFGVGTATRVTLLDPKGAAGRVGHPSRGYGGVRIEGTGGVETVSGDAVRIKLGLRSTLFSVRQNVAASPSQCDPVAGGETPNVTRVSGPERIATAVAVSSAHWPGDGARDALLATSENYPDALASGSLAAALDAPLLLTPRTALPDAVRDELTRLGVRTVWILGGEAAVSAGVEEQLRAAGFEVRRVGGRNRFETARTIALSPQPREASVVAVAMDQDWPSAVAAGGLAAVPERVPMLLVHRDSVPDVTAQTLDDLGAGTVLVVGGESNVAPAVVAQLEELGHTVRRLAGSSRFETSRAVADEALRAFPQAPRPVILATGGNFPDALTAGALAARLAAPLHLAPTCTVDEAPVVRDFLDANRDRIERAVLVGGSAALSERIREQVAAALGG